MLMRLHNSMSMIYRIIIYWQETSLTHPSFRCNSWHVDTLWCNMWYAIFKWLLFNNNFLDEDKNANCYLEIWEFYVTFSPSMITWKGGAFEFSKGIFISPRSLPSLKQIISKKSFVYILQSSAIPLKLFSDFNNGFCSIRFHSYCKCSKGTKYP